jgi:hypothetical protein
MKDPAIPTAANDSTEFNSMFPTMAVSVIERSGSAIPEMIAGIANLLIPLNVKFEALYIVRFIQKSTFNKIYTQLNCLV